MADSNLLMIGIYSNTHHNTIEHSELKVEAVQTKGSWNLIAMADGDPIAEMMVESTLENDDSLFLVNMDVTMGGSLRVTVEIEVPVHQTRDYERSRGRPPKGMFW